MHTFFSVLFCLLLAAPLVNAGPPNPTPSDAAGNTAGGTDALINTTGDHNTAFGDSTLSNNPFGDSNSSFGFNALLVNTTGDQNTASGANALLQNTTGRSNMANGFNALRSKRLSGNSSWRNSRIIG